MAGKKTGAGGEKYTREELATYAEALFGVKPEALAGALHGVRETELTLDEARGFVSTFMKRKVM
ncbi:hypothetical protein GE107_15430 [Cohnella sp. CFH 77786]|uniref:hypothetical protein n=1 Tax=Cohnella sp. CFH 77786 TaxID=2662265 RepID=UPI001C60CCA0|nr:hypothetical protein [Cohnella sp. CFH 77786]MBW5447449.1 hypothetical protein [Cohnella sp. CFH 77786]